MANAAVLWTNLADADDAVITADSEATTMPVSRLQTEHVRKGYRSVGTPAAIICDLGESKTIDTVALLGMFSATTGEPMGPTSTVRLRISTADATGAAGDALDTGTLTFGSQWFDYRYGAFVYAGDEVSGRYVRIDVDDPGAGYVDAGRLVIGCRTAFATNFIPNSARGWNDYSSVSRSQGGQKHFDRRPKARTLDINFDAVTATEWAAVVEEIDRDKGITEDMLWIIDPSSTNVARDSIWGTMVDISPSIFTQIVELYTKAYRLEERL